MRQTSTDGKLHIIFWLFAIRNEFIGRGVISDGYSRNIDALQEFCAWLSIIGLCKDCRSGADRSKEHLRGRGLRLWWGGREGGHARGGVIRSLVDKVWSRP